MDGGFKTTGLRPWTYLLSPSMVDSGASWHNTSGTSDDAYAAPTEASLLESGVPNTPTHPLNYPEELARCRGTLRESPGLCSPKWAVPPRLSCTCEVRPELLLLRERCCHHTERACDAPRLVRVDRAWCTPTSSVHKAACTIPVIECSQGPFECSVNRSYSN